MDTQYTFDTARNSYFAGHDLRIRWDDRSLSILVNEKDGMLAVSVKDHDTIRSCPLASQAAAEKIGDAETQRVYDRVQHDFWHWAGEECKDHGFETVYQAGRSGGWLAVAGTEHLDGADLIEPGEDEEDIRDRFLAFAFAVEQAIENESGFKQQFYAALVEAGEEYREPVDCPNCDRSIDPNAPTTGHSDGCLVASILTVLEDRDHHVSAFDITKVDINTLWDKFGGPAADWMAEQMGIPRYPSEIESLADEFTENGLEDVAEHLREHGATATVEWLDGQIADARENDDPEGWRLGNLEVAKDRLVQS